MEGTAAQLRSPTVVRRSTRSAHTSTAADRAGAVDGAERTRRRGRPILVAEDNEDIRTRSAASSEQGHDVEEVSNGDRRLRRSRSCFDLVLTDIATAEVDGFRADEISRSIID